MARKPTDPAPAPDAKKESAPAPPWAAAPKKDAPPAPETKEAKIVAPAAEQAKPQVTASAPPAPAKKSFLAGLFGGPKKPAKKESAGFLTSLNYIGLGKEKTAFVQNLATLLNAGLPLVDSLKTLQLETRPKPMKQLIQRIIDLVESGTSLWQSMQQQHFFTPYAIALIRIGEEAGNLARNMEYLSEQQEKDHALKQKVKMAMIYPTIVLVLVFVVVVGLGGYVLPNLIPVLYALGSDLPLTTRGVIAVSDFFTIHGAVAVPSAIAVFVLIFVLHTFTRFRVVTQWLIFQIPGIGRLAKEATIARFGVILGGLLKAGVPLVDAIRSLAEVTWVVSYKSFYWKLLESVNQGQSFQKSFKAIRGSGRLLPISVQQLVVVGEQSGSLADVLLKIADIYDRKASDTAQKLPIILEPMLLLFMGALVGVIAFAIIMPIYSVVGNVGR